MESYKYTAQAYDGSKHKGVVEASDQYDAISKIKLNYPIVETCTLIKKTRLDDILGFELTKSFSNQDLALLCQQCAIILKSGVSIGQCVTMVADQTKNKKYFYSYDGEGLRYEIQEFLSMIVNNRRSCYKLRRRESVAITEIIEKYLKGDNVIEL